MQQQGLSKAEYTRRYVAVMRRESGLGRAYARGCAYAEWNGHASKGTPNTEPERDAREMLTYLQGGRS